jgi:beta-mannosidase
MQQLDLRGDWQVAAAAQNADVPTPDGEWIPARVPGCIHTDLMAAGRIPDPFHAFHEKDVQWVADADWVYRRQFDCDDALLACRRVELVCDGLNTVADVYLNGERIGDADNMFIQWRWDVKPLLKPRDNELLILLHSPVRAAEARADADPTPLPRGHNGHSAYVRKAQYQSGWDWGPVLNTSGICRAIRLEGCDASRVVDVSTRTDWSVPDRPVVHVDVEVLATDADTAHVAVELTAVGLAVVAEADADLAPGANTITLALPVEQPKLWWPNGFGEAHLYDLRVAAKLGKRKVEPIRQMVGLRRVELVRTPDEEGESFVIHINGQPLFCRGANWIPADSFPTRLERADYDALVEKAADANMNMLRVWGGGLYESDQFYDACDRLGIMVWQDFMFACSLYPDHLPDFVDSVRTEAEQNVRRLRAHPSVVLWCGCNENQMMFRHLPKPIAGQKLYDDVLPEVCGRLAPDVPYWPGSPFNYDGDHKPTHGNQHYWDPWHGGKGSWVTRDFNGRFITEFGFMAPPTMDTIREYVPSDGHNMQSLGMEHRDRCGGGTQKMHNLLMEEYRLPSTFADTVYLMQMAQAEAVKRAVEYWRSRKFRTAGAIFWQFNDCWPVSSWSCLDYESRPKALYHHARRFFAPLLPIIDRRDGVFTVHIVNDAPEAFNGELICGFGRMSGEPRWVETLAVDIPPNGVVTPLTKSESELDTDAPEHLYFWCRLMDGTREVGRNVWTLNPCKHAELPRPEWELHVEKTASCTYAVRISSRCLARGVALDIDDIAAEFSDNYFDLLPELPAETVVRTTKDIDADELRRRLRVRSVFEAGGSA